MRVVTLVLALLGAFLVVLDGYRALLVGTVLGAVGPAAGAAVLQAGRTAHWLGVLLALGGGLAVVAPRLAVALFGLAAGIAFWTAADTGSTRAVAWGAGAVLLAVTAAVGAARVRSGAPGADSPGGLPDDPSGRSISA